MNLEELRTRAKELNIPGRSKLTTKAALEQAIADYERVVEVAPADVEAGLAFTPDGVAVLIPHDAVSASGTHVNFSEAADPVRDLFAATAAKMRKNARRQIEAAQRQERKRKNKQAKASRRQNRR